MSRAGCIMVKITGMKAHKARLSRIRGPAMIREIGKAIFVASDLLKVEAQISITTGAVSGANHVASTAPNPPNNDTGTLADGIVNQKTGPLTAETSSNADYGAALEFGTSKMAARPYMAPAAEKTRPKAQRLVMAAVKRVVSGGTL